MSPLYGSIDVLSFVTGGIGALGISIQTRQIVSGLNLSSRSRRSSVFGRLVNLKQALLIQTRGIENFFVGGCLYCAIRQVLLQHNWKSEIIHSVVCGTLVGAYQSGIKCSWKRGLQQVRYMVGVALLQESAVTFLLNTNRIVRRPTIFLRMNFDPILYIVGAVGACVVGLFTDSFAQDIPELPLNDDDGNEDTDNITFFKYILGRLLNDFIADVIIEVRRERRFFLGGSLAWTAEHFCRKFGVRNKVVIVTIAGGLVGAYFGTYGDEPNQVIISSFGVASAGLVYGTLVNSNILQPGHTFDMCGFCLVLFPLFHSLLG